MSSRLFAAAACLALGVGAQAATIIKVDGPDPFGFVNQPIFATGWHQTSTYTSVFIYAPLRDGSVGGPIGGVQGTAYLMNQIGPGTTAANEVAAPVAITNLIATYANRTLFSGLTLGPGDYYLVIVPAAVGPLSANPQGSSTPAATLGAGVSQLNGGVASAPLAPYAPASAFVLESPANIFMTVTGNAAADGVPEPSAMALAGAALALLAARRRKNAQ